MTGNSRLLSALQPEPHETLTFKSCHLKKQNESIDIKTGPYDVSLSKVLSTSKKCRGRFPTSYTEDSVPS